MPRRAPDALPKYAKHKQSGQARVILNGRHFLLGPYGSKASLLEYDRLLAEWVANGRQLPQPASGELTISIVIVRFWEHARQYYTASDGAGRGELDNFRHALKPLRRLYGATPAKDFGPLALKAVREEMLKPRTETNPRTGKTRTLPGWSRTYANRQTARLKQVFKWATENELIPPAIYQALVTVSGLRKGRTEARETEKVRPVREEDVAAVLPYLSPQVGAMVRLQLLTGARGDELRRMRTCDVDTTGDVWVYRPAGHKTAHHGHAREIRLGPKAKEVLALFLKTDLQAYVFSPADAVEWFRQKQRENRKSPITPSQRARAERARQNGIKRRRRPGGRYSKDSYAEAIERACDRADREAHRQNPDVPLAERIIPRWHPHQLRHTAATRLRKQYGLEATRAVLGQRSGAVTEVYAEIDAATVDKIMGEVG